MSAEEESATCPLCGGRGWVVEPDGGAGSARRCSCRIDGLASRLLSVAGIPPRYAGCRLTTFKTSHPDRAVHEQLEAAVVRSRRYVEEFLPSREGGLVYVGPPGVGKTHLAVAVLVELIERYRVHGRFVEFTSLVHQIQSTFDPRSPESKREVLDPVVDAEVLVLDELGAQNPTPWVRDVLYLVINSRYTRRLPTLFTTNYRLEPRRTGPHHENLDRGADPPVGTERFGLLSHRLPGALISRLYEMARVIQLDAVADQRLELKALLHRD